MAPLELRAAGEPAAQDLAFRFQLGQPLIHQLARQGQIARQFGSAQRAGAFEPSTQNFGRARFGGFGNGARRGRCGDGGLDGGIGIDNSEQVETFRGDGEPISAKSQNGGAAGGHEHGQVLPRGRALSHWEHTEAQQGFVQLVGVAHGGPDFGGHLGDGGGIQNAGAFREIAAQRAPQLNGAGAAFFERRIVQEGVRPARRAGGDSGRPH